MTPDQPISLAVALVGSVLSLALPKRYALLPLALSLCLYPSNLLVPPQNLSFTPQRIIAGVLLLRCIFQPSIRSQFRWRLVDTVALVYFVLLLIAQVISTPTGLALNNRAGFFLSAMVPFWCVRLLITDRESFCALFKAWLWAAVPLAILGIYQMHTGDSPYFRIMEHGLFWIRQPNNSWDMRSLFGRMYYRASGPFLQFIMYGWFFALLIGPITNLYFQKRKLWPWILAVPALPIGVIASISGGPKAFSALSVLLLVLFPWRRYWKIGLGAVTFGYLFLLVFSNRSPMEFLAQYGMDAASSWYRVSLQKYTLYGGGMSGHWLAGYGEIPPDAYARFHDLCIHWVWLLVVYGIMGVAGFYGLVAVSARSLWTGRARAQSVEDRWLLWSLFSTLVATLAGMLLVALFSEMYYIYHMFLGVIANAHMLVGSESVRQVSVAAEQDGRPVVLRFTLKPNQALALVRPVEQ